jgi:hypothetical protein
MRTIILAAVLGMVGLIPHHAVAQQRSALHEPPAYEAVVTDRQSAIFQVQPTATSVEQALSSKGPATPAELGLKRAIERSANTLHDKLIICRGC